MLFEDTLNTGGKINHNVENGNDICKENTTDRGLRNVTIPLDIFIVIQALWQKKVILLLIPSIVAASFFVINNMFSRSYQGSQFLRLSALSETKKPYSMSYAKYKILASYLNPKKELANHSMNQYLSKLFSKDREVNLQPQFMYNLDELRQSNLSLEKSGNYIWGVNITLDLQNSFNLQNELDEVARQVRTILLYADTDNEINANIFEIKHRIHETHDLLFQNRNKINLLRSKSVAIKAITKEYSDESKSLLTTQVISLNKQETFFLSPIIQQIGTDAEIADLTSTISFNETTHKKLNLLLNYYTQSRDVINTRSNELEILAGLKQHSNVFLEQIKDANSLLVDEIAYEIKNVESNLENNIHYIYKFNENGSETYIQGRAKALISMAFIFIFVLITIATFVIIRKWWQINRDMYSQAP